MMLRSLSSECKPPRGGLCTSASAASIPIIKLLLNPEEIYVVQTVTWLSHGIMAPKDLSRSGRGAMTHHISSHARTLQEVPLRSLRRGAPSKPPVGRSWFRASSSNPQPLPSATHSALSFWGWGRHILPKTVWKKQ